MARTILSEAPVYHVNYSQHERRASTLWEVLDEILELAREPGATKVEVETQDGAVIIRDDGRGICHPVALFKDGTADQRGGRLDRLLQPDDDRQWGVTIESGVGGGPWWRTTMGAGSLRTKWTHEGQPNPTAPYATVVRVETALENAVLSRAVKEYLEDQPASAWEVPCLRLEGEPVGFGYRGVDVATERIRGNYCVVRRSLRPAPDVRSRCGIIPIDGYVHRMPVVETTGPAGWEFWWVEILIPQELATETMHTRRRGRAHADLIDELEGRCQQLLYRAVADDQHVRMDLETTRAAMRARVVPTQPCELIGWAPHAGAARRDESEPRVDIEAERCVLMAPQLGAADQWALADAAGKDMLINGMCPVQPDEIIQAHGPAWYRALPVIDEIVVEVEVVDSNGKGTTFDLLEERANSESRLFDGSERPDRETPIPVDRITVKARLRESEGSSESRVITVGTVDWCIGEPGACTSVADRSPLVVKSSGRIDEQLAFGAFASMFESWDDQEADSYETQREHFELDARAAAAALCRGAAAGRRERLMRNAERWLKPWTASKLATTIVIGPGGGVTVHEEEVAGDAPERS